jgi:predicted MPP superfamily phosphohydrolase
MVQLIQSLDPHVVLFTGDLVDQVDAVPDAVQIFDKLRPKGGIWAVPGNWDHTADAVETLRAELAQVNVQFLINQSVHFEEGLWIVGVDDPASSHDDVSDALVNVPAGSPRILLAHSPAIADSIVDVAAFDLILVGHTHGGQINLPLINGTWLHESATTTYVRGLYDVRGSAMYVNRGIGTTTLPVRIGSRPEITHFTFHAA